MNESNFDFLDKRFVVTGASSGMGRQVAVELAEAGAQVLAIARREYNLEELTKQCPVNIMSYACDVCDKGKLEAGIKAFVQQYGKINGSVHAAGISDLTPIKMFDECLARQIMDTNFWSGIYLAQLVTKNKYSQEGSSNILFSSVSGHRGEKGMFAYSASKAALQVAVKSIAKEIAVKRHRINTVSPGWVQNEMADRAGQLTDVESVCSKHLLGGGNNQDVSGVVLFLLSNKARWITGADIVVDGGYLA